MTMIRIHVAGSLAWQSLLLDIGPRPANSPAFLCGEIASPMVVRRILAAPRMTGAIVLQRLFDVPNERTADLEGAADRVTLRVEQIRNVFEEIGPGIDLVVEPCGRCLENVQTMLQADRRKLEKKRTAELGGGAEVVKPDRPRMARTIAKPKKARKVAT